MYKLHPDIFKHNRLSPHGFRVYIAFLAYTGGRVTALNVATFAGIPLSSFQKHFRNVRDCGFIRVDRSHPKEPKYYILTGDGEIAL